MRFIKLPLPTWLASLGLLTQAAAIRADGPGQQTPVPRGEVKRYSFDQSKIFPGTLREYWIYVPRQYDPERPACLYVNQDGVNYNAPQVFDELIARKEMPVTIGVFVAPGHVKAEGVLEDFRSGRLDEGAMLAHIPDGRIAEGDDIAEAVLFLCSDRARHIIGHVLTVDGGEGF